MTQAPFTPPALVVDLQNKSISFPERLAVQVCAGLLNRDNISDSSSAFVLLLPTDLQWLATLNGSATFNTSLTSIDDFLTHCLQPHQTPHVQQPAVRGYIRFNYTRMWPQGLVPLLVTLAGVLDAVPLEDGSPHIGQAPMVFDADNFFPPEQSIHDATAAVFAGFGHLTTSLAFLDPGFNKSDVRHPMRPPITEEARVWAIDHMVKLRLFTCFLYDACIPQTEDHALLERMSTNNSHWPSPVPVYGYNGAFPFHPFEAETDCVSAHNMGQIGWFLVLLPFLCISVHMLLLPNRSSFHIHLAFDSFSFPIPHL